MAYDPLSIPLQNDNWPPQQFTCTYCDDGGHVIQNCPKYDFHHDPGSPEEAMADAGWVKGRDWVLARRKQLAFGGIPEMYLQHPTSEDRRKLESFRVEEKNRIRACVAEARSLMRKPLAALQMERGFCHWSRTIWLLTRKKESL